MQAQCLTARWILSSWSLLVAVRMSITAPAADVWMAGSILADPGVGLVRSWPTEESDSVARVIEAQSVRTGTWSVRAKRMIDVLAAASGLIVLSPIMVGVSVAIRVAMGPPILFRQVRPGYLGKPFTMLKFRTMRLPSEGEPPQSEAALVTGIGTALRRSSLDELPQLWNVLKGDMSLVGPRPLAMEYLAHYTIEQRRRHDVRPGVTGWAQVTGRHLLSWEDRFEKDVWYVDNWSLWLDLRIVGLTARALLSGAASIPPPTANFGAQTDESP